MMMILKFWNTNSICLIIATIAVLVVGQQLNYLPLVPYHRHHERIRRRLTSEFNEQNKITQDAPRHRRTDAIQVGALYQGYGTHYVDLWVGTPDPQRQTLIVDTGTGASAFPCSSCVTNCGDGYHIDKVFNDTKSKTFKKVSCDACKKGTCHREGTEPFCKISMSYQEGSSWYAFEARDQVYIGGPHDHGLNEDNGGDQGIDPNHAKAFSFEMTFGCISREAGLFKTQLADGVMGMDSAPTAFNKMMYDAGKITSLDFSLCFSRQPTASRDGTEAGAMTMGGYDDRFHKSPIVFSLSFDKGRKNFYNVHIRKIYLRDGSGGESVKTSDPNAKVIQLAISENQLNADTGATIVSGTTDTYFTAAAATEFKRVFKELSGKDYGHGAERLTEEELMALPTILIQLAGDIEQNKQLYPDPSKVLSLAHTFDERNPYDVIIAIPPSHYMEYDDMQKAYVNRFYVDERDGSVFGSNMMMGHDVYFSEQHNRIGWSESDCDYHSIVTDNGFTGTLVPDGGNFQVPNKSKMATGLNEKDMTKKTPICSTLSCRGSLIGTALILLSIGLLFYTRRGFETRPSDYSGVSQESNEMEMRNLGETEERNGFYNIMNN